MGFVIAAGLITWVCNIFIVILLARSVLSWFVYSGGRYNNWVRRLYMFLSGITEPVVAPVRRFLSRFIRVGNIDLAPLATFFIIIIVSRILTGILIAMA